MYNKTEIEKNMRVFTDSLDEVFAKLLLFPDNEIFHGRAEMTLALGEFAQESLSCFDDEYIRNTARTIALYKEKYEHLKTVTLKSGNALENQCASSYIFHRMPEHQEILQT